MFKKIKNFFKAFSQIRAERRANEVADDQEEKKKGSRVLKIILVILLIIFIIVLLLRGCSYRYYTPTQIFQKVAKDTNQEKITDEIPEVPESAATEVSIDPNHEYKNHVTLYSETLTATASNGVVNFKVRNFDDSNQDIVAEIYVQGDELGSEEAVCIARSGAIEPGYQVSTIDLVELDDGSTIPAGEYKAFLKENYYNRETGELSCLNGSLEITLVVN